LAPFRDIFGQRWAIFRLKPLVTLDERQQNVVAPAAAAGRKFKSEFFELDFVKKVAAGFIEIL
jgi:hypothetical protein